MIVSLDLSSRLKSTKTDITRDRDAVFEAGFTFPGDGLKYPCDPVFQEAVKTYITAYISGMLNQTDTVRIRRYDNSFWFPAYAELLPFAGALMIHVESIWTAYWTKKDNLIEATNG